ncbi:MAG: glycogen synthase GlgA [Planctomycetia bacterium]|nr:glycogen synthase GlgA [Planctomycetia bacterium]
MRIVHAASEVVGFAKTGGLADVAGSLPRALARRGHDCAVVLPLYRSVRHGKQPIAPTEHVLSIPVGNRYVPGRLWRSQLPDSNVPVWLIEQSEYFERDDPAQGRSFYQFSMASGQKLDYPDNCERFVFFSRAVLEALRLLDWWPDVLHSHDWQTALTPVYLQEVYRHHPNIILRQRYEQIRSVFTIHNIAYQGLFRAADLMLTGLDWRLFNHRQLEFYGQLNFLKSGIVFADRITTVSPRYAEEIQTPYFGNGLQGVLSERRDRLSGIVNGVDYDAWNPATDSLLAANYDDETVAVGKAACKAALQKRYGLPEEPRTPILGMVARLVEQKGLDLTVKAADALLNLGAASGNQAPWHVQLIVLGEGDPVYHRMLQELRERYPDRIGLTLGFDETLAHQIEAGADIFLMPSLFEPSGLNQLYSLKYGTVPVVRACGGLYDTIADCTPEALARGEATGFRFVAYTSAALLVAVQRALELYRQRPDQWLQLMRNGMRKDWSWNRSAGEYEQVYQAVVRAEA